MYYHRTYSLKNIAKQFEACKRYYTVDYSAGEMLIMSHIADAANYATQSVPKKNGFFKREYHGMEDRSMGEELDIVIARNEERLKLLKQNREKILELENKFKRKDVIYHKSAGPCIFKRFQIYSLESMGIPEGIIYTQENREVKDGDILAVVNTVDGQVWLFADEITPYTENVKLLYEAERSRINE